MLLMLGSEGLESRYADCVKDEAVGLSGSQSAARRAAAQAQNDNRKRPCELAAAAPRSQSIPSAKHYLSDSIYKLAGRSRGP